MRVLSLMIKIVVQVAIVVVVPGGLPAVLIYQYRRLQKRRQEAIVRRQNPGRSPSPEENADHVIPESPR